MDKIITLEFKYRSKIYCALIRTKLYGEERIHRATIMNGDLERQLYGHHIIVEKKDVFQPVSEIEDERIIELQQCIIDALSEHKLESSFYQSNQGIK